MSGGGDHHRERGETSHVRRTAGVTHKHRMGQTGPEITGRNGLRDDKSSGVMSGGLA